MSTNKKLPSTGQRKTVEHEGTATIANEEYYARPYSKLKPASSEPLADRVEKYGFELSMLIAPEALGRVLVMLNDTSGVHSLMFHGMSTVVESTDEVL